MSARNTMHQSNLCFWRRNGRRGNVWFAGWLLALVGGTVVAGCARQEPATLTGEITYLNEPVNQGTIRLYPIENTPGIGAAVAVTGGRYEFTGQKRIVPGVYRVEIFATRATGRKVQDPDGNSPAAQDEMESYLPLLFNEQSVLTVDVAAGANQRNFNLQQDGERT